MREFRLVITPFCNYRCFFCHGESACKQVLALTPSDYVFIAEVGKTLGWDTVTITGGEPLISPIFSDVCERLKQMGIAITVVTNASLLARPKQMLKDVAQLNVSLHTMDSEVYKQITQTDYPLEKVLDSIVLTRASLPELAIHLNYTVVQGLNDSSQGFEKLLQFAREVKAEAKFIDLSSEDVNLATKADTIVRQLQDLGFEVKDSDDWQFRLSRDGEKVRVTRCPFNGRYKDKPPRDVFVDSDGTLYKSYGGVLQVNALNDIKSRETDGLIRKVSVLLGEG